MLVRYCGRCCAFALCGSDSPATGLRETAGAAAAAADAGRTARSSLAHFAAPAATIAQSVGNFGKTTKASVALSV